MSTGGVVVLAVLAWSFGAAALGGLLGRLIKIADHKSAHHH